MRVLTALAVLFPLFLRAQSTTAGYLAPAAINVAPGQIITLFVHVPNKPASGNRVTATPPLPNTLGGFSIVLRQTFSSDPIPVPIQTVSDAGTCSVVSPAVCDNFSMVTVQIPFALIPNVPRTTLPANFARLEISYNSAAVSPLFLNPVPDAIHAATSCDANDIQPGICAPYVRHADGTLVDLTHPARSGEPLTIELVGMGAVSTSVTTGAATPNAAPAVDGVLVSFDPRVNASPSQPEPSLSAVPDSARLRPGAVGIYDVTFTAPPLPAGTPPCSTVVNSNLTVNIGRTSSWDGVPICVVPPAGVRTPLLVGNDRY